MLYNLLKILHILFASGFLTGIAISIHEWVFKKDTITAPQKTSSQTILVIIPLALIQLLSGFTMISLKQYDISQLWITGSTVSFILVISSWLSFLYFSSRRLQIISLFVCISAISSMIFFMANKII